MPKKTKERNRIALKNPNRQKAIDTIGFGVPFTSDPHHFKVIVPCSTGNTIRISEYFGVQAGDGILKVIDRAVLTQLRWAKIRSDVERVFNTRLAIRGLRTSSWSIGENSVDRLLGKELCVLAWAVEELDPAEQIPTAIQNWLALRPEERWWLFGMTAMKTGTLKDTGRGWRLALRHALGGALPSESDRPCSSQDVQQVTEQLKLNLFSEGPK